MPFLRFTSELCKCVACVELSPTELQEVYFSPQFEMERGVGRGISNGKEEISLDVIREKEVVADHHGLKKAEDEPIGRKMVAGKTVVKVDPAVKTSVEGDPNGRDVTDDKTGDDAEKAG